MKLLSRVLLIMFAFSCKQISAQTLEAYFSRLYPAQPAVEGGGMVKCIAVNPINDNEIIVSTSTGGLFKSMDHSGTWRNLFNLPLFEVACVQFTPNNIYNVIATGVDRYGIPDRGGIWVSHDHGESWSKGVFSPALILPADSRLQAGTISSYTGSNRVIVATNFGVAISDDNGDTWRMSNVPGGGVYAVALLKGDRMVAANNTGIYYFDVARNTWVREATGIGMPFGYNSFEVPAINRSELTTSNPVFVVTSSLRVMFSLNAGQNWLLADTLPTQLAEGAKGTLFVRLAKAGGTGATTGMDMYVTNRYGVFRKFCPRSGTNFAYQYNRPWQPEITIRHSDMSDLSLDHEGNPYLLGGDGGLQKFHRSPLGDYFNFEGGGSSSNGLHALQVTEVTGCYVYPRRSYDMYFATQDNSLYASENLGASWNWNDCCEGFFLEQPRVAANENEAAITYTACSGCGNKIAKRLFRDWVWQSSPVTGATSVKYVAPQTFLCYSHYVDSNRAARTHGTETGTEFWLTQNYTWPGATPSWTRVGDFRNLVPRNLPKKSGSGTTTVWYQAYKSSTDAGDDVGGYTGSGIQRVKLMRMRLVSEIYSSGASYYSAEARYPAMRNFGSIGVFPTEFSWYEVFGVDPANPQHVIAADALNSRMMESVNGGDDWTEMTELTRLVTSNGGRKFKVGRETIVTNISFNPEYPQMVLIGTRDNGMFYSWNNGANWSRIPGSDKLTEVSSFYFQNNNTVWVSSYGRGIWKMDFAFRAARINIRSFCGNNACYSLIHPNLLSNFIQQQDGNEFTRAILISGGSIADMSVSNGYVQSVTLTPDATMVQYTDTKDDQLPFKLLPWDSLVRAKFAGIPGAMNVIGKKQIIKGILLKGNEFVDVIYGDSPSPFPAEVKMVPYEDIGAKELNSDGKPQFSVTSGQMLNGYCYLREEDNLVLHGKNFKAGIQPLVFIDGKPASFKITNMKADGSFDLSVPVKESMGYHTITVTQQDNQRLLSETDEFIVLHEDRPMGAKVSKGPPILNKGNSIKDEIKKVINPNGKKDQ